MAAPINGASQNAHNCAGAPAPLKNATPVERAGLKGEAIERIYMGCVLPAGLGQAPARQAALGAGLPEAVPFSRSSIHF